MKPKGRWRNGPRRIWGDRAVSADFNWRSAPGNQLRAQERQEPLMLILPTFLELLRLHPQRIVRWGCTPHRSHYLDTTSLLSPEERALIQSTLPALRDWYVQAGGSGMNATDTLNNRKSKVNQRGQHRI